MIKAAKATPAKKPQKKKKAPTNQAGKSAALRPIKGITAPHVPSQSSRNHVILACLSGLTQEQTATSLGISENTLRKHYKAELASGGAKLLMAIAANLASIAQNPNHPKAVTAAIFWLKTKGGFREVDKPEDPDNPEEHVTFTINIGGGGPPKLPGDGAKVVNA